MSNTTSTPLGLIAELTHRCPLHCVYCSNPLQLNARANELSTEAWIAVFREAAALGVLQTDFTGGEPLARQDIVELVSAARGAGLYVNLITSGLPLDETRLEKLVAAGLDHFQLSFQGAGPETAREISGTATHAQKLRVLAWLSRHRLAVTLNFVIHRRNIHQIEDMLAIAEASSATRVEFAHVQYYGWALANRDNLLPTREQLDSSLAAFKAAQQRLRGKMRIEYVVPDYYAKFPKACMGGWGQKLMLIEPSGDVLPCHAARVITGMAFENVKYRSLREIWETSAAFQKFRGQDWMQEPCRTCSRRDLDFGGCRCQAMMLANDAAATDPVCSLSPMRNKMDVILTSVAQHANEISPANLELEWKYRVNPA